MDIGNFATRAIDAVSQRYTRKIDGIIFQKEVDPSVTNLINSNDAICMEYALKKAKVKQKASLGFLGGKNNGERIETFRRSHRTHGSAGSSTSRKCAPNQTGHDGRHL